MPDMFFILIHKGRRSVSSMDQVLRRNPGERYSIGFFISLGKFTRNYTQLSTSLRNIVLIVTSSLLVLVIELDLGLDKEWLYTKSKNRNLGYILSMTGTLRYRSNFINLIELH